MNPRRIATVFAFFAVWVFVYGCSKQGPGVPANISTIAGSNGEFGEPFGIIIRNAEVFISDGENGKLFRLTPDNGVAEFASALHTPSGIAFDAQGNLIVADSGSNSINESTQMERLRRSPGSKASAVLQTAMPRKLNSMGRWE
jgi:sugar lactone lactonase YvrE